MVQKVQIVAHVLYNYMGLRAPVISTSWCFAPTRISFLSPLQQPIWHPGVLFRMTATLLKARIKFTTLKFNQKNKNGETSLLSGIIWMGPR